MKPWPRDPANQRLLCAPAHPMPVTRGERARVEAENGKTQWSHTNVGVRDVGSDYYEGYVCLDCGHEWTEELPE